MRVGLALAAGTVLALVSTIAALRRPAPTSS
jgi:hypothetical protein